MRTSLDGIARAARRDRTMRFRSLYSFLNHVMFERAYRALNKDAAVGVDKVSWEQYGENLQENLLSLEQRLRQKRYRARFVKRVMIPKDNGTFRPISIPAIEDKIVQYVVKEILEALFEPLFKDCSYGYRPKRSARQAVEALREEVNEKCTWVVEADIRSYFDTIDHGWLEKMLCTRIDDRAFIALIQKWLRAGILKPDGAVEYPEMGSPQGSLVSPVLSNIYLHYVLDKWFVDKIQTGSKGRMFLIRYADDFVAGFQLHKDAARFKRELKHRMAKFGLTLAADKTRKIMFNRFHLERSEPFDFLGFTFTRVKSWRGGDAVRLRTSRKKVRKISKAFKEWCKKHRNKRIAWIMGMVRTKFIGLKNYFGISGNAFGIKELWYLYRRTLYRWLNRRSERKSYNWKTFAHMLRFYNAGDYWYLKKNGLQMSFLHLL